MKLAFSTLACPDWSTAQVIDAAVAYDYDGIEWRLVDGAVLNSSMPLEEAARIGEATRKAGLSACAADTGVRDVRLIVPPGPERDAVLREARAMLKIAAALGAGYLRVFPGACPAGIPRDVATGWAAEILDELAADAHEAGVAPALELHDAAGFRDVAGPPTSSAVAMEILDRAMAGPGVLWDWGNTVLEGEAPEVTWERVRSRLLYCHTKDLLLAPDGTSTYVAAGSGSVPIPDILQWLGEEGMPELWLSYEWEKKWHPELAEPDVALPQYIEYLRSAAGQPVQAGEATR